MASPAQIAANIRNAQRSTGPRTGEGKRNSNQNSRTHGLRSQQPLHPTEDPAEFTKLVYSLMDEYAPANQTELLVVVQIAASMWQVNQSLVWEWAYCADGMTTRAILQCVLLARYRVPYQRGRALAVHPNYRANPIYQPRPHLTAVRPSAASKIFYTRPLNSTTTTVKWC